MSNSNNGFGKALGYILASVLVGLAIVAAAVGAIKLIQVIL